MEIEEMETIWQTMSQKLNKEPKLNDQIIRDMIEKRYHQRFDTIQRYESIGAIVCLAMALFILANIQQLDTWYLLVSGVLTIAYLLTLPILVLQALYRIRHLDIAKHTYQDTLIRFTKAKNQLLNIQKTGIFLNGILVLLSLPVASKILKGKDIFLDSGAWYWYIPIMLVFLFFFSRWGYNCYRNMTASAENILKELE